MKRFMSLNFIIQIYINKKQCIINSPSNYKEKRKLLVQPKVQSLGFLATHIFRPELPSTCMDTTIRQLRMLLHIITILLKLLFGISRVQVNRGYCTLCRKLPKPIKRNIQHNEPREKPHPKSINPEGKTKNNENQKIPSS